MWTRGDFHIEDENSFIFKNNEILKRTVIVEAENLEEAIQKVEDAVEREEIIWDVDDYDDREIAPSEYWKDGKVPEGEDVSFYWYIGEDE